MNEESITREELDRNLLIFNENPYARVDISEYVGLELYKKNDLEVSATLRDIKKRRLLRKNIEKKFEEIDKNELEYESMSPLLEEYYVVTERTILESDIEAVRETIEKCKPEILKNEETLIETVVDMLVCKRLMGFWDFEYFMFELYNKSIEERRKFVSNIYRTIKLSKVNDKLKGDIFDNKYKAYLLFNDFYDREMVLVDSEDCLKKFKDFIQKHEKVVVKPANGAMGDNIRLLKIDDNKDILNLFENLRNEIGDFIIEELIIAGRDIKTLNPDSVNTVRLSTYFNGKNVYMHWPFMKIGRSGFFVDNGGAGGILVAIDEKTGKFISDGIDENCNRYVTHPDNGIVFKGYKLPDWEKALDLGKNIAMMAYKKIPEVRYIGWDITYTEEGKWIVIEGNSFTQFIGQQAPLGIGVKDRLDEIIF